MLSEQEGIDLDLTSAEVSGNAMSEDSLGYLKAALLRMERVITASIRVHTRASLNHY